MGGKIVYLRRGYLIVYSHLTTRRVSDTVTGSGDNSGSLEVCVDTKLAYDQEV